MRKKLLIVTDAWNQVNGVCRTLETTIKHLSQTHDVEIVHPDLFENTKSCPGYPEIRLAFVSPWKMKKIISDINPDMVHISVEGPLGISAKLALDWMKMRYTTAYHTRFSEYLQKMYGLPLWSSMWYFQWFHGKSSSVLVSTQSLAEELSRNFVGKDWKIWTRGFDKDIFKPEISPPLKQFVHGRVGNTKYAVYVGRVSVEKNIEDFLNMRLVDYAKVVVGSGPQLHELRKKYPDVIFTGPLVGEYLAAMYAGANVMVFPSKSDTFGLCVIEALACGTPVVAYDVQGPRDILRYESKGALILDGIGGLTCCKDELAALTLYFLRKRKNPEPPRDYAESLFTWEKATKQFVSSLVPAKSEN